MELAFGLYCLVSDQFWCPRITLRLLYENKCCVEVLSNPWLFEDDVRKKVDCISLYSRGNEIWGGVIG